MRLRILNVIIINVALNDQIIFARQRLVTTSQKLRAEHAVCMWHAQGMPLHVPKQDWACVIKSPFNQDRASTPHHGHRLGQTAAASTNHVKGKHRAHTSTCWPRRDSVTSNCCRTDQP